MNDDLPNFWIVMFCVFVGAFILSDFGKESNTAETLQTYNCNRNGCLVRRGE